jgi:hypothetical protein
MATKPRLVDDPNTFIPPAVRRLAEQAEQAFRAQQGQQGQPEQPPQEQPPPQQPPQEQPAPPAEAPPPAAAQQLSLFPQQVTPQVTSPAAPPVDEESWQTRYKAMEGRYKRAENDIRSMSEQIASMQNVMASMQRPAETPAELRPQSLLTPEEVTEYGSEFLDVVARRAKEELNPEVASLRQKLTNLERQLASTAEQNTMRGRFELEATLDQRVPHWRDINVMPEFHAWLALPDTYSGAIRHDLLKAAYAQNNAPRTISFFKGFLDQEAAYVPQGSELHLADGLQTNGKVSLETFAAPGRAKTSAASTAPVEKPIITRAQISHFYAESASGKYRGREAEKAQLEAMIFDAEREGRIR